MTGVQTCALPIWQAAAVFEEIWDTIEVWAGLYKENVVVNTKVAIVGAGPSRTIIDARYRGPAIKFNNYQTDYSSVKNLRVTHSSNISSYSSEAGAIYSYYSDYLTIQNVHFYNTFIGFKSYGSLSNHIHNSTFDRGSATLSSSTGIYIYSGYKQNIRDNEITSYYYGIYQRSDSYGSHYYNNYIHNNTYGIYLYQSAYYSSTLTNPIKYVNNRLVDNSYAFYNGY